MKGRKARKLAQWSLIALLAVGSCGYGLVGQESGLPREIRTVYIEPLANRSRDPKIAQELVSALRSEFHRRGRLSVVDQIDAADAILSGLIRIVQNRVVAVNRFDEALQLETVVVVDMTLRRRVPDEIIWRMERTRFSEFYAGSRGAVVTSSTEFQNSALDPAGIPAFTDIQLTESLSAQARGRLVERFARDLHQRLLEMF